MCYRGVDDAHFNIVEDSLVVASVLDFEAPVDADSNNSYDICIRSTDSETNTFDKTFSIEVVDRTTALLLEVLEDSSSTGCGGSVNGCLLYTSPSPRDRTRSRMPSSA